MSAKANFNAVELEAYQKLARIYLGFSNSDIATALETGELQEVYGDDEQIPE